MLDQGRRGLLHRERSEAIRQQSDRRAIERRRHVARRRVSIRPQCAERRARPGHAPWLPVQTGGRLSPGRCEDGAAHRRLRGSGRRTRAAGGRGTRSRGGARPRRAGRRARAGARRQGRVGAGVRPDDRPIRGVAPRAREGAARGADRHHHLPGGRIGHRQGSRGAVHPPGVSTEGRAIRRHQLRGAAGTAPRIGALRVRTRSVHRRGSDEGRADRAGRPRRALSR